MSRRLDPTVCSHCGTDQGSSELPQLGGGIPCCEFCAEQLRSREFPRWLKASAVGLLALLGLQLWTSRNYVHASVALVRAQRHVASGRYQDASPLLDTVLELAPSSSSGLLLKAKVGLLAGDPGAAIAALRAYGSRGDGDQDLAREVSGLLDRFGPALQKIGKAAEIAQKDQEVALVLVREAKAAYPQWKDADDSIAALESSIAFDHGDYDRFLAIAEGLAGTHPQDHRFVAALSSALAVQYAKTGEARYRMQAEQMLARADELAVSPQDRTSFEEYAERIRHRIDSREIISPEEYNRRFRSQSTEIRP